MTEVTDVKKPISRETLVLLTRIILGAGVIWIGLSTFGLLGSLSSSVLFFAAGLGFITIFLGAIFNKPKPYSAWLCFLTMVVLFATGCVLRINLGTLGEITSNRAILPDLFIFGGYAFAAIGLLILTKKRTKRFETDGFIDASIAALAVMLITWVYLVEPALAGGPIPMYIRLIVALYAPASIFLVSLTINYAYGSNLKVSTVSTRYLIAALGLLFIGDIFYMLVDTDVLPIPPQIFDAPYALGFLLFPLAALHPSVNERPAARFEEKENFSLVRLGMVGVALIFPVIITLTQPDLTPQDQIVIAILLVGLSGLAVLKLVRALLAQRAAQMASKYQATHDSLTGLPNRTYALQFLNNALTQARLNDTPLSVIFMDLDRFKYINDTLGHATGDALITEVGKRVRSLITDTNLVARLGGDEFVISLKNTDTDAAVKVCEKIQEGLSEPFTINGLQISTGATLGVSSFDNSFETTGPTLIEDADTALYAGKAKGRGQITIFDNAMREKIELQAKLETSLRGALERGEISLAFQPIYATDIKKYSGAEALIRWQHPTIGPVSPLQFIPLAEDTGLIVEIGKWVLQKACQEVSSWRQNIDSSLKVSVNISARQLSEASFLEDVKKALSDANIPGSALDLEITESLLVAALEQASGTLNALKELGVTLSVDDFGTGYSSLAYLKNFPVSTIKIDRSFIRNVTDSQGNDQTLIRAIVAMSNGLGMKVLAEGVEVQPQLEIVNNLGVNYIQGYYFSVPVNSEEIKTKLKQLNA